MDNSIVVADAGPLIAFGRLDFLPILTKTLGSVIIPESMLNECTKDTSRPGANAIQTAINNKIITVHSDILTTQLTQLQILLGRGESMAILLAIELSAGLLIDEKLARSVAKQHNLKVIGTVGVLLLAKQKKVIPAILPVIQRLKEIGYYLSDILIEEVLKIADEC